MQIDLHNTIHDMEKIKFDIVQALQSISHGVYLTFTKANGELRQMQATLCLEAIPEEKRPSFAEGTFIHPADLDTVRVFDVDKQEWRSFRWDSLNKFEVIFGCPALDD